MSSARIELPPNLLPIFVGDADVRGAYGGRGSGKTRSFAKMSAAIGYRFGTGGVSGLIVCGRQYMNSLEDSSLEEVKRAIEEEPFLAAYYDVGDKYIKSRDGRITYAFVGLDRNIASIKSKGRILLLWVDEAEPVTEAAWQVVEPTLREEGELGGERWQAELWVTWNPAKDGSPTDLRYRKSKNPRVKVAELNWRDNPRFPAVLERKRQADKLERPASYGHIWEGEYATVMEGAYYAALLTEAKAGGRIGKVEADPLMAIRLFADIGGTGAKADSFVFWAMQFVGREIRVLDHYEAQGQPLGHHLDWLRSRGYEPSRAQIWLPHDGDTQDKVHDASYAKAFRGAGYSVTVVPNQGRGAAKQRIEAARNLFGQVWFDEERTAGGRSALGWYHEKRDPERNIGLGPNHDWASHSADAYGLAMCCYQPPSASWGKPLKYPSMGGLA